MIQTLGLTKHYGSVRALSDVTIEVRKGEVFGLLGPNGSGKTTAIRLLLGLLRPTSGRATVGGHDCWRDSLHVRDLVSFLPGELRLFGPMTGFGTLRYLSDLRGGHGLDRAVAIAEKVLKLDLARKVKTYSTGMKQKLALAQTFADPVEILILDEPTSALDQDEDEPTSALDPSARQDVLGLVTDARSRGQTIIFSGHVLSEVEQVADRVAIMRLGKLVHVEDMHTRRTLRLILMRFNDGLSCGFPDALGIRVRERNGDTWLLEHHGELPTLMAWLSTQDFSEIAIGTDDLRSLYDRFHGVTAEAELDEVPA